MTRLVLIGLACLMVACTKAPTTAVATKNLPELTSIPQVNDWTKNVSATLGEVHEEETDDDDRLMNSPPVIPESALFKQKAAEKNEATGKPLSVQVKVQGNQPTVNVNQDWNALANSFGALNPVKTTSNTVTINSPVKKDLSQAGLSDFKYVGLLSQPNGQTLAYVKVNDRLFKVKVGDLIGQGHWRVVSVDADRLQLLVAGKTTGYERK